MEMRVRYKYFSRETLGKTVGGSHGCTAGYPIVTRKNDISLCIISLITLSVCECVCVCECERESVRVCMCVCARAHVWWR